MIWSCLALPPEPARAHSAAVELDYVRVVAPHWQHLPSPSWHALVTTVLLKTQHFSGYPEKCLTVLHAALQIPQAFQLKAWTWSRTGNLPTGSASATAAPCESTRLLTVLWLTGVQSFSRLNISLEKCLTVLHAALQIPFFLDVHPHPVSESVIHSCTSSVLKWNTRPNYNPSYRRDN